MVDRISDGPAKEIDDDADASKAPDPRRHYASPEDLRDGINLDIARDCENMKAAGANG